MEDGLSHARLDLAGVHVLRAYLRREDTGAPLEALTQAYEAAATVVIAGDTAEVLGLHGRVSRAAYHDFEHQLRLRGVSRVFWERHRADGAIKRVLREI